MALEEIGVRVVANGVSQYVNGLKQMDAATDAAAKGMQNLSKQTDTAGKTMDAAKTKSTGFGAALGSIAKIAGGFVLAQGFLKLPGIFSGAVQAASSMNETLSKSQVVFGDLNKRVLDFGATSAKSIGLSTQKAIEATATFGNFLTAMGVAKTKALDFSLAMVKLAADLASFNNASPEEVLLALRAGLSGEAEPLKRFGVAINELAVSTKAAELGLEGVNGKLTEGEKVQARYALVMEQTTTAQGDFARTSDGLANRQRILAAQFEDLRAKIGSALLPVVLTFVRALNEGVLPAITNVAKIIGTLAQNTLGKAFQLALPFIQSVTRVLGDLIGVISRNRDLMIALGTAATVSAIPAFINLAGVVGNVITKLGGIAGAIGGAALRSLDPRFLAIAAAAGIAAFAIVKFGDAFKQKPILDYDQVLKDIIKRFAEIDAAVQQGRISPLKGDEIKQLATFSEVLGNTETVLKALDERAPRITFQGGFQDSTQAASEFFNQVKATTDLFETKAGSTKGFFTGAVESANLADQEIGKLKSTFDQIISSSGLTATQIDALTARFKENASTSPAATTAYQLWTAAVEKTDPIKQAISALEKLDPKLAAVTEETLKTISPLEKMKKKLEELLKPVTDLNEHLDPLQKALSGLGSALTPELASIDRAIAFTDEGIAKLAVGLDEEAESENEAIKSLKEHREELVDQRDALLATREALAAKARESGVYNAIAQGVGKTEEKLLGLYPDVTDAIGGQTHSLDDGTKALEAHALSAEETQRILDELARSNLTVEQDVAAATDVIVIQDEKLGDVKQAAADAKREIDELSLSNLEAAGHIDEMAHKTEAATGKIGELGSSADTNKPKVVDLGIKGGDSLKNITDKSLEAANTMPKMGTAADLVATVIGNAMLRAQQSIQRIIDLLRKTEELRRALEQAAGTIAGEATPHAQHGASVRAGQAHIVGEEGRELYVPSSPGFILPHRATEQILSTAFARPAQRQLAAPSMTFAPNYAFQGLVTDDLRVWAYRFTEEFLSQARAESQRAGSSVGGSLE